MKTPRKVTVDTMPADKFFAYAAEILKLQPPHVTDEPILAQMKRIGIERGKGFDLSKADPAASTAAWSAARCTSLSLAPQTRELMARAMTPSTTGMMSAPITAIDPRSSRAW